MNLSAVLLACSVSSTSTSGDAGLLCRQLIQVRVIPFNNERVDDEAYNALKRNRLRVIPCLIERLTDLTPMRDPRKAPSFGGTTVGDVAYFLLVDFTCVSVEEMFPDELKCQYARDGVYAFFQFVENPLNRGLLQDRWRSWLADPERIKDDCQHLDAGNGDG